MNKIRIAGAAAGVVLVSGMVLQVSSAAFTDTTENAGNEWGAGTVYLSDDDGGLAMFSSTSLNIVPGYSETRCMTVEYEGTVDPTSVSFAGVVTANDADAAGGNGLADDLDLVVEMGPEGSTCVAGEIVGAGGGILGLLGGGTTEVHEGTLLSLQTEGDIPLADWAPDGQSSETDARRTRTFRFTVSMPDGATNGVDNTPNDAQGDVAEATFSWSTSS